MDQQDIESPLILVVSDGEWAGRSLESVLQARDHVVTRSLRGREAVTMLGRTHVDAVIAEEQLHDMPVTEFCRQVRAMNGGAAIPVVVIASHGISPRRRVEMYSAGAWDYCSQPLDIEVLLLKLETFISARRELPSQSEGLVDSASDLYTLRGFRRWSRGLSARALRGHEPLACLALAPASSESDANGSGKKVVSQQALARATQFIAHQRRESDVAAYVGGGTFAILAPATGPEGAEHFSERLKRAAYESTVDGMDQVELQVGYSAVEDFATADLKIEELLTRANTALSHLRRSGRRSAVLRFDDITM
jgi:two-component system cell cycle response regulator